SIRATVNSFDAIKNSEVSIICVGTPSTNDGHLDMSTIFKVAKDIGESIKNKDAFHVVIIRSTVLPGTNEKVKQTIQTVSGKTGDKHFAVVSNPEFLREGTAVKDYYNPPFTLIGATSKRAIDKLKLLYKHIDAPFITTDIKIAEMIKYVNNAFHAQKIIFANEIGNICKKLEIDSHKLMEIFCMDTKLNISPYYLKPGFAYGGSCLPKDLKALRTIAHDNYLECPVLDNIERSNEFQKRLVLEKIIQFEKDKIGFLGLSFKAGTDDLRNSPILDVIEILLGKGFDIRIYDNNVNISKLTGANKEYILKKIPYVSKFLVDKPEVIIDYSDLIVVVNKEKEFADILNKVPEEKTIYDLVNIEFKNKEKKKNYSGVAW
ncbi:MAG: nucleotide sugar dehydrogenase, partial [Candidatus Hodarchaeota archaeon]